MKLPPIQTPSSSFKTIYDWADKFTNAQWDIFWKHTDYKMSDDLHSFRTDLTKPERLMIIESQVIFQHYEVRLGEFWNSRFKQIFPRYEFDRLGSTFGAMESGVHSPFYIAMTDALGFNTEEFHDKAYLDTVLSRRLEFVTQAIRGDDDLHCLGAICFLEGTALFSALAALMSFRKPGGINAMTNMVSGIVHSCADEQLHSQASAACFKALKDELKLTEEDSIKLFNAIYKVAIDIVAHEILIIEKLFSFGEIRAITKEDMITFVKHRADECLKMLGYEPIYNIKDNPIGEWFYVLVNSYNFGDFFVASQKDYSKTVNSDRFTW